MATNQDDDFPELENEEVIVENTAKSSWFELSFIKPASVFVADGIKFAKECKTGEDTTFSATLLLTSVGAVAMGLLSFLVKIVHIPITEILVAPVQK